MDTYDLPTDREKAGLKLVAIGTNFFPGTAATSFFSSILIPAAQQIGFNPASMAMLIPNIATGVIFP